MKIKVHKPIYGEILETRHEKEWGPVRQTIFWFAFCAILTLAAFESGYILGYHDRDEIKAGIQKLNGWVLDHGGRLTALETMDQRRNPGGVQGQTPQGKDAGTR